MGMTIVCCSPGFIFARKVFSSACIFCWRRESGVMAWIVIDESVIIADRRRGLLFNGFWWLVVGYWLLVLGVLSVDNLYLLKNQSFFFINQEEMITFASKTN